MPWCLKCQAENRSDATACVACGSMMAVSPSKRLTGWSYVFYMATIAALVIGLYFLLQYLKAEGYITGWLADRI